MTWLHSKKNRKLNKLPLLLFLILHVLFIIACNEGQPVKGSSMPVTDSATFVPPDTSLIPHNDSGNLVRYGRDLILHTASYLGPNGTIGHYLGNKMNCGNCHMDAGTRPYGLNFYSTFGRYPQYRARENAVLSLADRVNNCIERPHNGTPMPADLKEMQAIVAYIKWLSDNAPKEQDLIKIDGAELAYPNRAADPGKGAILFAKNCASCHGADGQGVYNSDSSTYIYPPLWGRNSYQAGSSMHRVLKTARFIKTNMPDKKAHWDAPVLTDEEAIDVAAFINDDSIHARPTKNSKAAPDYPVYKNKPIDYDIGPFLDTFSATQHKYGPYKPIIDYHKQNNQLVVF